MKDQRKQFFFWLGVFVLPLFWSWGTLAKGFSCRERLIAFLWMAVSIVWLLNQRSRMDDGLINLSIIYPAILAWLTIALLVWLAFRLRFIPTIFEIILLVGFLSQFHPTDLIYKHLGQAFNWQWLIPPFVAALAHLAVEPENRRRRQNAMTKKTVKAVIFDVYHTLLAVEPGPEDAAARWVELWHGCFDSAPAQSLTAFDQACREQVELDHARRKAAGTRFPEVDWRHIARLAAPALSALSDGQLDAFLSGHAKLQRSTHAMPGAWDFLINLQRRGIPAGIASNAQRYTFDEMDSAGMPPSAFAEELCFWSFEQGFSKPDPAVFAWLTQRLAARGILPEETLMIGDRPDNDIAPASAAGWQTWHFQGAWPALSESVKKQEHCHPGCAFQ